MNYERRRQVEDLFEAALELDAGDRETHLEAACSGDPELLAEVQAMLAANALAEQLFDGVRSEADGGGESGIGPYRVLRELGRGGMGVVHLAERADGQYRRRVAIKVIPTTRADDPLHQRFLAERQILAGLDHPNIARLLDGGITEDGRPYLVLEYVEGVPITQYCDRHRLGIDDRLKLFVDVCAAVQHAHANLVIHRDLKPGNILVTSVGHVRLLDFGIAKLINPALSGAQQPETRLDRRLMTPEYASPEQVRGEPLTTASDLYSLGVLLYELLAGSPPYTFQTGAPVEVAELVCGHDPERPSARVLRTDAGPGSDAPPLTPEQRAALRNTVPDALHRRLRGDLDSIVLMALRKEPARRYGSADLLAQDIRRHLDGFPVGAHRGSRRYRAAKLIRRHRIETSAAALILVSLLAGLGATLWQNGIADRERDRAEEARVRAEMARAQSEEVTAFLMGLFQSGESAGGGPDGELTARDLLRRGTLRAGELADQPLVQARLLDVLGQMYHRLGDFVEAGRLLDDAIAARRSPGAEPAELAESLIQRAIVHRSGGDYDMARASVLEALDIRRRIFPPGHGAIAEAVYELGYLANGREQERLYREAFEILLSADTLETLQVAVLHGLSTNLRRQGRFDEAVETDRQALRHAERLFGPQHYLTGMAMIHLADHVRDIERDIGAAEQLYRRGIELVTRQWGENDMRLLHGLNSLGRLRSERGDHEEAERLYRRGAAILSAARGVQHPSAASQLVTLAEELERQGRYDEAESLARSALATMRANVGTTHPLVASALLRLGSIVAAQQRFSEANVLIEEAIAIHQIGDSLFNVRLAEARRDYGRVLARQGRFDDAQQQFLQSLAILERAYENGPHPNLNATRAALAELYIAWGRPDDAEPFRSALSGEAFIAY